MSGAGDIEDVGFHPRGVSSSTFEGPIVRNKNIPSGTNGKDTQRALMFLINLQLRTSGILLVYTRILWFPGGFLSQCMTLYKQVSVFVSHLSCGPMSALGESYLWHALLRWPRRRGARMGFHGKGSKMIPCDMQLPPLRTPIAVQTDTHRWVPSSIVAPHT